MTAASLRLPDELSERLQKLAVRTGRSTIYYMLEAINNHLTGLEDLHLADKRMRSVRAGRMGTVALDGVMKRSRTCNADDSQPLFCARPPSRVLAHLARPWLLA